MLKQAGRNQCGARFLLEARGFTWYDEDHRLGDRETQMISGIRILIVDDHALVREALSERL